MQSTHFRFQIRRGGRQSSGFRDHLSAASSTSPGLKLDPAQTHQLQLYHHHHRRFQVMGQCQYKDDPTLMSAVIFLYAKDGIGRPHVERRTFDSQTIKPNGTLQRFSGIANWLISTKFYIQWSLIISHSSLGIFTALRCYLRSKVILDWRVFFEVIILVNDAACCVRI